ncbi:hypothetical protein HII30_02100 [Paenibacillus lemnae]|uniref:Amidase n=2 Tax=Paenibacillus lemnae TaxID=1330551 RepID=A0A848M2T4_PAELE|nr:hypothetical protein [Paenibacillus lemnae]
MIGAVVILAILGLVWSLSPKSVKQDKATWLWDAGIIKNDPEDIVAFSRKEGVTTIFLQIQSEVREEDYRRFNALAHQAGIQVHALDGQPEWAYIEHQDKGVRILSWVEQYNAAAAPDEQFQGLQLDVEPYVLKRWEREEQQVVTEWSENMEIWSQEADRQELHFSAAVPFWLDNVPSPDGSRNFGYWIQERTDSVAVMSYRDDGEQMYELARQELEQADELGTSVWIGMELADTEEGEHLTFYGKSQSQVNEEALRAASLGTGHSSFAGLAVHHYEAWHHKMNVLDDKQGQSNDKPVKEHS